MAVMSAKRSLTWWRNIARPILSEATPLSHCARSHTRRASSGCRLESQNELNGPRKGDTVVVAMSGGVDSSVAALLMAQQDFDVRAVYMRNWSTLDERGTHEPGSGGAAGCEWQKEWEDVQAVCNALGGIPCELADLSREYWLNVFEPALDDWASGTTPNPDINCNREIKFGALMDRVLGVPEIAQLKTWLATGHYAHVGWSQDTTSRPKLMRAQDRTKDQTYYLSSVQESRLARAHFPLAPFRKPEVREMARKYSLPTAAKKESMGICFVGNRKGGAGFNGFLEDYIDPFPGAIVTPAGVRIGTHRGLHTFTIGQGARIGGATERWFVARKDIHRNEILVVQGKDHPALLCVSLTVPNFQWIWTNPPAAIKEPEGMRLLAQVRHRQMEVECIVKKSSTRAGYTVTFPNPVLAVSPGQTIALWDGNWCLGSGTIQDTRTLEDQQQQQESEVVGTIQDRASQPEGAALAL